MEIKQIYTHYDTDRMLDDHEERIRVLEQIIGGLGSTIEALNKKVLDLEKLIPKESDQK